LGFESDHNRRRVSGLWMGCTKLSPTLSFPRTKREMSSRLWLHFFLLRQVAPDVANGFLLRLATLASSMLLKLINSGTTAITSSSLIDKATGLKLLKVLASVKDLPSITRGNLEGIGNGGINYESRRLRLRIEDHSLTWWTCEAKNYSSDNSVECVQGEEGQEMEACGRVSFILSSTRPLSTQRPCS